MNESSSQYTLCGLALLSIKEDVASELNYKEFIAESVAKKAREVTFT